MKPDDPANIIEESTEDALRGDLRSSDVTHGDPLKNVVANAEDARTALSLFIWQRYYDWHEEEDAAFAEDDADMLLVALFPFFRDILSAGQRKAWAEGAVAAWNAAKQNIHFPESPNYGRVEADAEDAGRTGQPAQDV